MGRGRKRTVYVFNVFLTIGKTIEIIADKVDTYEEGKITEFRRNSLLVGRFRTDCICGYTKEEYETDELL